MRILAISDLHFSNKHGVSKPMTRCGMTDTFFNQLLVFNTVIPKVIKREDPDFVVIAGDVFDRGTVEPITLSKTIGCFESVFSHMKDRVFIFGGNHDTDENGSSNFLTDVFDSIGYNKFENLPNGIHLIPYCNSKDFEGRVKDSLEKRGAEKNIVFCHQTFKNARQGKFNFYDGIDVDHGILKTVDLFISGHFHEAQKFNARGYYLGSPFRLRFDDAGRKATFGIVDTESLSLRWLDMAEECAFAGDHALRIPEFHTIEVTPKEIDKIDFKKITGDFARIAISCDFGDPEGQIARKKALEKMKENDIKGKISVNSAPTQKNRLKGDKKGIDLSKVKELIPHELDESRVIKIGKDLIDA